MGCECEDPCLSVNMCDCVNEEERVYICVCVSGSVFSGYISVNMCVHECRRCVFICGCVSCVSIWENVCVSLNVDGEI